MTVPDRACGKRPGIVVHSAFDLQPADRRLLGIIPVTSPARTLLDLAGGDEETFERAFDEAVFHRKVRPGHLRELLERSPGRRGVARLRTLVEAETEGRRNRLQAEKRLARLIRAAGLPAPAANARVGRFVVDFVWPKHRVVVELAGFGTHGRRAAFEADRARDAELQAMGYRVVRVTWRQLTREPHAVVARIAGVLAASGGQPALGRALGDGRGEFA